MPQADSRPVCEASRAAFACCCRPSAVLRREVQRVVSGIAHAESSEEKALGRPLFAARERAELVSRRRRARSQAPATRRGAAFAPPAQLLRSSDLQVSEDYQEVLGLVLRQPRAEHRRCAAHSAPRGSLEAGQPAHEGLGPDRGGRRAKLRQRLEPRGGGGARGRERRRRRRTTKRWETSWASFRPWWTAAVP